MISKVLNRRPSALQNLTPFSSFFPDSAQIFFGAVLSLLISLLIAANRQVSPAKFLILFTAAAGLIFSAVLIKTIWFHSVAELLGGKGKISKLLSTLTSALFPFHLLLPLTLIGRDSFLFLAGSWLGTILWSASLGIHAIKENYRLSNAKVFLLCAAPFPLFLLILVLTLAVASLIATGISILVSSFLNS